jgi:Tol biopolymer transport system component/peroxiredoxin
MTRWPSPPTAGLWPSPPPTPRGSNRSTSERSTARRSGCSTGRRERPTPTWSPDGRWLAFFANGKLEKIELASGAVQTLADAPQGRGIAWGPDDAIVYAPDLSGPLWKVSAGGGNAAAFEKDVPKGVSHRDPRFLPDGKSLLYLSMATGGPQGRDGLYALDLDTGNSRRLLPDITEGRFVPPGYLAFVRDDNLMVQPFDPGRLKLSGEALPLAQNVQFDSFRGTAVYAFAGSDVLVYQATSAGPVSQLTWYDPSGKEIGTVGKPLEITAQGSLALEISPEGQRAIAMVGALPHTRLWMVDLASGGASPFTSGDQFAFTPVWSPDGKSVIYGALPSKLGSGGVESLFLKRADGGSPPEKIATVGTSTILLTNWSPDGSVVAFMQQSAETKSNNVGIVSVTGNHQLKLLVHGSANESGGRFSPDGKWLAYTSDASGSDELCVTPYPGPGGKWQLTSNGTRGYTWASDHEIYNVTPAGKVYAIELVPGEHGGLEIGSTRLGREPRVSRHRAHALDPAPPLGLAAPIERKNGAPPKAPRVIPERHSRPRGAIETCADPGNLARPDTYPNAGNLMRRVLAVLADLLGSVLLGAAFFFDVTRAVQSRTLVYLFFLLPGLVALGLGFWRGKVRALPVLVDLALLNLLIAGGAILLAWTEGARTILLLPVLTLCASGLGIAAGRKTGMPQRGKVVPIFGLFVFAAATTLTLAVHSVVESFIAVKKLNRPAPSFELVLLDGGTVSSQSLKGRVVVLDFWTTWCQPCRREFPELEKVYARFRARPDVAFYAVDGDRGDTPEQARRYFQEAGYRIPVAYDHGSKVYTAFGAPGFPTLVVIDREGRLRFRHTGFLGAEDFIGNVTALLDHLLQPG